MKNGGIQQHLVREDDEVSLLIGLEEAEVHPHTSEDATVETQTNSCKFIDPLSISGPQLPSFSYSLQCYLF